MRLAILTLLACLFAPVAQALVGQTEQEAGNLYGTPQMVFSRQDSVERVYATEGITIRAVFEQDNVDKREKIAREQWLRPDGPPFSSQEIDRVLDAHAEGQEWSRNQKDKEINWLRADRGIELSCKEGASKLIVSKVKSDTTPPSPPSQHFQTALPRMILDPAGFFWNCLVGLVTSIFSAFAVRFFTRVVMGFKMAYWPTYRLCYFSSVAIAAAVALSMLLAGEANTPAELAAQLGGIVVGILFFQTAVFGRFIRHPEEGSIGLGNGFLVTVLSTMTLAALGIALVSASTFISLCVKLMK